MTNVHDELWDQIPCSSGLIFVSRRDHLKSGEEPLKRFMEFMARLFGFEQQTNIIRPLIWLLDEGGLSFEDDDARGKWLNLSDLRAHFSAIRRFANPGNEHLWPWLCARAVIAVQRRYVKGDGLAPFLLRRAPLEWQDSIAFHDLLANDASPVYSICITPYAQQKTMSFGCAYTRLGLISRTLPALLPSIEAEMCCLYAAAKAILDICHPQTGDAAIDSPYCFDSFARTNFEASGLQFYKLSEFLSKY